MNMKTIVLALMFIAAINWANAKTIYVNAAVGCDTCDTFMGDSPQTAFKTIEYAVKNAESGDEIEIEGENIFGLMKEKNSEIPNFIEGKIHYFENIILEEDKQSVKIIGVNEPVMDGSKKSKSYYPNVAIKVFAEDVIIENMRFENYLDTIKLFENFKGGAAIYLPQKAQNVRIQNNYIENCNYGIFAYEAQVSSVNENKIRKCPMINISAEMKVFSGGCGIMYYADLNFMQGNRIGTKGGNKIDSCELYGIFYGGYGNEVIGELTKIANNQITNTTRGYGMGLANLRSIVTVEENTFDDNNIAMFVEGENIETNVTKNIFKGSKSEVEIMSDEKFPGQLLNEIWMSSFADNEFDIETYAIFAHNDNVPYLILDVDGFRYITNKPTIPGVENKESIEKIGKIVKYSENK